MAAYPHHRSFWQDARAWQGSITPHVLPHVFSFGLISAAICMAALIAQKGLNLNLGFHVAPYEIAGATLLALLLVLRTNSGYERWWEARKLWGGIVNQSRNLAITATSYGPNDPEWREQVLAWTAAFSHTARCALRGEEVPREVSALVGEKAAAALQAADHKPSFVAAVLAQLLREACESGRMDRFAFLQADKERALLMDHLGGCERILKTPLARVYAIKVRRFIFLFMLSVPVALMQRMDNWAAIPVITMMVAYPIMSLDQIGIELQNPFSSNNLSHLPLNDICATIERNVMSLKHGQAAALRSEAYSGQQSN